ncbi:MAG: GDSL family lipase, partial [Oscillospiraceae bacterium]|nr:GDSL family lipase [Oscillospiraceae bacterium]
MNLFQKASKTKSRLKRFVSGVTASALALTAFAAMPEIADRRAEAAAANWKFDLGGAGTARGYTGVSAGTGYNASNGYGFSGSVSDVTAGGSGALSDAVRFTGGEFRVDLPNGLYQVTVTTGNSPRTSITMEGMLQMINLCGNNA